MMSASPSQVNANCDRCETHGEVMVGYVQETGRMVCNTCIY